ncbi:MAG: cation-translocating P-type ATPase [Chloroflexota bacterium]|nr:cation-translocating P-type ATPase [Chloroflexota bacterium]
MLAEKPVRQNVLTTLPWHLSVEAEVMEHFGSDVDHGLNHAQVEARLEQYGPNELVEHGMKNPLVILWEQIRNPLVLLLIFAAVVSALLGKVDNVIAISAIVVLNAVLGVVQEYRAEQAMAALKKMAAPLVRVRRNVKVSDVQARDLVPGDIVLLEAGSIVPADLRLYESANLSVQEAALTGESQPVNKIPQVLTQENAPLGDRYNMLYMGTTVTYGRGVGVVVETAMKTELGRIAELIQTVDSEKTPLQHRMDELGKVLIAAAGVILAISVVIGLVTGDTLERVLLNSVAIAVAVVPEGLPAVVTIALALGAQRMLQRKALIRKLPAVETLGSVTTICSDKTGTLTENRMTVTIVDVAGHTVQIDEVVKGGMPALTSMNGTGAASQHAAQAILLAGSALCNDSILESSPENSHEFTTIGDPTEAALVVAAARFGLLKQPLDEAFPRVGEVPFDSERKRMTTLHSLHENGGTNVNGPYLRELMSNGGRPYIAFTKGAVDSLLEVSSEVWIEGQVVPLTPELRRRIEDTNNRLAQDGLRVLGLAYRYLRTLPMERTAAQIEHDLVIVGMVGIIDPPRKEVKAAVQVCRMAGIRPVMITGDHPLTAYTIARELGIAKEGDQVLTGQNLSQMSQQELEAQVEHIAVYARVSPEHKLNIVQALQNKGHVVAMTGDGVNDAPALKRSNIGVAMGITGTAVSKEASDMVILDDNFTTIVSAVEEGRTIYDNVRRFVKYLLASNTGELFVLLITQLIAGMTIPLTTLQILWMNLITDGVPALALGVEKAEKGVMNRPPYAPNESLFGRGLGRHILLVGALLGITGVALGYWAWSNNIMAANGKPAWNTMVFIFLTIAQMGHVLGLRSHRESLFKMNFFSNRLLLGAVFSTIFVQLLAVYLPFFNDLFNTNPLTLGQLAICLVLSTIVFWGVELEKMLIRRGVLK